jgi:shikimate dehydrogenase
MAARSFKQELVALFGDPVAENPTQAMVEAAFRAQGLDWRYLTLEVKPAGLRDAVLGARALGLRGFHCTIPHKVAVIPHLDGLAESARVMGAVNCVVRRGEQLIGENTDGKGFVQSLRELCDPRGKQLVLFGAGGAARAIAVETALAGAKSLTIVNRDRARGQALCGLVQQLGVEAPFVAWRGEYRVEPTADVVINCTSIGLFPDVEARVAIDLSSLLPSMIVADVIPNPPRTRLLREAEARGCRVLDGLGMLVNQGVIGIELWTGVAADPVVMRRALEEIFG